MGCKHSKPTTIDHPPKDIPVVPTNDSHHPTPPETAHHRKNNNDDDDNRIITTTISNSTNQVTSTKENKVITEHDTKDTTNIIPKQKSLRQSKSKATTSTSSTTTTLRQQSSAPNPTSNNSIGTSHASTTIRSSDRVYKLLWKAYMNSSRKSSSSRNNHHRDRGHQGTASHHATTLPITSSWDERAVLQAMSPQAASYRNPDTYFSPLHLAVQLMDSHSISLLQQPEQPSSSLQRRDSTSSSSLLQVITELIKAYPDAVHTPDRYGYIPLHYAIAPLVHAHTTTSMATTTRMSTYAMQQQQQSSSSTPHSKFKLGRSPTKSPTKTTVVPTTPQQHNNHDENDDSVSSLFPASIWPLRTWIVRLLLQSDTTAASFQYLSRNDVSYNHHHSSYSNPTLHHPKPKSSTHNNNNTTTKTTTNRDCCSPLYRILQMIPDDSTVQQAPTLEYVHVILKYMVQQQQQQQSSTTSGGTFIVSTGNRDDGDTPLALLYRRFTRQFDVSEQFFPGDNSRPEVVQHRQYYKMAASNTWKMMELLIQQQPQQQQIITTQVPTTNPSGTDSSSDPKTTTTHRLKKTTYRIVHRAVQGETPPDLLRYIVETNAEELTIRDELGNVPLHYAARYRPKPPLSLLPPNTTTTPPTQEFVPDKKSSFPAFYSKYVMDELLYKYPEAASIPDRDGHYPLLLAVQSGKPWIGGGIQSLYQAYPDAMAHIDITLYPSLQRALNMSSSSTEWNNLSVNEEEEDTHHEEKKMNSPLQPPSSQQPSDVIRDEPHDAIMLVQAENVDISEVVTSMWAHEEDAGVQMLGCIAIRRLLYTDASSSSSHMMLVDPDHCLRIALSAVPAVVNAMKAHPNEVIVQEKACHTLRYMASADGQREVSFVASGAVAAIVGAMQAHVSDPKVQEEACGALSQILHYGGPDRATVIASVSGLTAMINAMAAHSHVAAVQREGCRALLELTHYRTTAHLPELPKSPTESLLEQAQQLYPEECREMVQVLLSRLT